MNEICRKGNLSLLVNNCYVCNKIYSAMEKKITKRSATSRDEQRSVIIKNMTESKASAQKYLKAAGILDKSGRLSDIYR